MPLVQIKVLEGALSAEQKKEMISRVSEIVAESRLAPTRRRNCFPTRGASLKRSRRLSGAWAGSR